ncbi:hypothetical protein PQE68_gp234 [Bacillus phage vB_BanS_Sophrita]|uniref:Uncharacterized protein n=1 Tax=Bacillus phage vB_BanS_Sophrita TaxID=2894790 RepID=A0AAE8YU50_9CAUD|nr:hypothetical protein PQE68_gp234 [Bacillus phage vB_BanS_Sophrita]UGO50848.1 hypothetical protein SOPHRITA_261 [Bacillus phage vB_BanS_Sophrita]
MTNLRLNDFQRKTLDEVVVSVDYEKKGLKTTIAFVTCKNGYEVVGTSGCVDPKDFNFEIGKHYALVDALNQIGKLEGYYRQGMNHDRNQWTTININLDKSFEKLNGQKLSDAIIEQLKRNTRKEEI